MCVKVRVSIRTCVHNLGAVRRSCRKSHTHPTKPHRQFCVGESQSRLYPHMRAKFGRGPTAVSKKVYFKLISRLYERYNVDEPMTLYRRIFENGVL